MTKKLMRVWYMTFSQTKRLLSNTDLLQFFLASRLYNALSILNFNCANVTFGTSLASSGHETDLIHVTRPC